MRHDFLVKTHPQAAGITHEAKRNRSTGRPDLDISKKIPIEMARSVLTFFDNKPPQMAGITHEAKRNPPPRRNQSVSTTRSLRVGAFIWLYSIPYRATSRCSLGQLRIAETD